ncbi:MAG TPA: hemerythrin domain-containing protein [Candidatus Sulfotelmatobacter sp.]|nr:hemerythrin domain-containing protein [Candidatus Sulfotelmatobacter sp.]
MASTTGTPRAVWAFTEHEHRELAHGLDRIHDVACGIGGWVEPDLSGRVLEILTWLERDLEPHVAWEESWLYPQLEARTGSPWVTRFARFDHHQIRDMAARVGADQERLHAEGKPTQLPELKCHLFSLEALLRAHLEREERYLIPLLEEEPDSPPATIGR